MDTIVLELVDGVIERHEGVVDGVYLHIGIRRRGTEHEHSKTTEAINAQLCRRGSQTVSMSGVYTTITSPHCPQLTQSAPGRRQLLAILRRSALRKCCECLFGQCGRTLIHGSEEKKRSTAFATRRSRSHRNSSPEKPRRRAGEARPAAPGNTNRRTARPRPTRRRVPTLLRVQFATEAFTVHNTPLSKKGRELTHRIRSFQDFGLECATCERLRNNVLISVCKQRGHKLQLKHLLCTPANSR